MILPAIIIAIVAVYALFGFKKGLFLEIIALSNVFISFALTFILFKEASRRLGGLAGSLFAEGTLTLDALSFGVLLMFFYALLIFINNRVFGKIKVRLIWIVDKPGGLVLGALRGIVVISLILVILAMSPIAGFIPRNGNDFSLAKRAYMITPRVYESLTELLSDSGSFDSEEFFSEYGGFFREPVDNGQESAG
ncbi:MAG: CvpA family protein [Candidatus Omnitrophica bacterium]|nr:CvpA family protein [Candidatus Omnitrophota bacterium]